MKNSEIFISYAWGGESEKIVNELDNAFKEAGILLTRDKRDLGFKGIITNFMNEIGTGKAVVLVISDKYLKSPYCMYELLEIYRNLKFEERIFPIVLGDAKIFEPLPRLQYLKYWKEKKNELDTAISEFGADAITVIGDDYKTFKKVFDNFGEVVNILKDINSLTPEMHKDDNYSILIKSVSEMLSDDKVNENNKKTPVIKKNKSSVEGSGNIVLQDIDSNGNITINVNSSGNNEQNKKPQTSAKERINTSLKDITDFRKKSQLKRLEMQYKLLDDYENKLMLSENPTEKMRCENEIERLNEQIEKLEKEINN